MLKKAEKIAREYNCAAIVVGDTDVKADAIAKLENTIDILVIRPVIGYNKKDIEKIYKKVIS